MSRDVSFFGNMKFQDVRYKRRLSSLPSGIFLLAIGVGISAYGAYHRPAGIERVREKRRERNWQRIYLTPLLLAEQDRLLHRYMVEANMKDNTVGIEVLKPWKFSDENYEPLNRFY